MDDDPSYGRFLLMESAWSFDLAGWQKFCQLKRFPVCHVTCWTAECFLAIRTSMKHQQPTWVIDRRYAAGVSALRVKAKAVDTWKGLNLPKPVGEIHHSQGHGNFSGHVQTSPLPSLARCRAVLRRIHILVIVESGLALCLLIVPYNS